MGIAAWRGTWIAVTWLAAIALAVGVVRFGDSLRATRGDATGFCVGRLFMWIMWVPLIVTGIWLGARGRESPGRCRVALVILGALAGLWVIASVFEVL